MLYVHRESKSYRRMVYRCLMAIERVRQTGGCCNYALWAQRGYVKQKDAVKMVHGHIEGKSNRRTLYTVQMLHGRREGKSNSRPCTDALLAQKRVRPNCVICYRKMGTFFLSCSIPLHRG